VLGGLFLSTAGPTLTHSAAALSHVAWTTAGLLVLDAACAARVRRVAKASAEEL
jgi:hypothetical protein